MKITDSEALPVFAISIDDGGGGFWTTLLPRRGRIAFQSVGGTDASIVRDSILLIHQRSKPETATPPENKLRPLVDAPTEIRRLGNSIARLSWPAQNGVEMEIGLCSGFLLTSEWLITNAHCMLTSSEIENTTVLFDYDRPDSNALRRRISQGLGDYEVFLKADLAIYRLDLPVPDRIILPWTVSTRTVRARETLFMIQHPQGSPKMISVDDCYVTHDRFIKFLPSKDHFGHFCDTEAGSSGSPVLDANTGWVVGVHEAGGCETQKVSEARTEECVNRALKIDFVRKTLANAASPKIKTLLIKQLKGVPNQ